MKKRDTVRRNQLLKSDTPSKVKFDTRLIAWLSISVGSKRSTTTVRNRREGRAKNFTALENPMGMDSAPSVSTQVTRARAPYPSCPPCPRALPPRNPKRPRGYCTMLRPLTSRTWLTFLELHRTRRAKDSAPPAPRKVKSGERRDLRRLLR